MTLTGGAKGGVLVNMEDGKMKELDRIFFGQPMAWREGFFYAIECRDNADAFYECMDDLVGAEKEQFSDGWRYAVAVRKAHNKALNES